MLRQSLSTAVKATRSYATAVPVKAPIALHGIDGRYATALFSAASRQSALETVEADLSKFATALEQDPRVLSFLENPSVTRSLKLEGIKDIAKNSKWSSTTTNFFALLAENGRLADTNKIISSYKSLMGAYRGEVIVTVSSAKPLDAADDKQVRAILSKAPALASGKSIRIEKQINPSLVGGLLIEFGDKTIDLTVASKLTRLNKLLTDSV